MIINRKIQLDFTITNRAYSTETLGFLKKLNEDVFQAANHIVNHQYFNELYNQRMVASEFRHVDNQIKETKKALKMTFDRDKADILEDKLSILKKERYRIVDNQEIAFKETFGVGQQHTTYDVVKELYPEMSSSVLGALNYRIFKDFKRDLFKVKIGERSLSTYRKGMPIPFMVNTLRFSIDERGRYVLKWINKIKFFLHFGSDKSNNEIIIRQIIEGVYKAGISAIQIKDDKVFLLLSVDIPNKNPIGLNPDIAVGVDLGITIPAYCALSVGKSREALGHSNDFLRVRLQMQNRRKRLHKSMKLSQGGKGKNKKLKVLEKIKECEKNFVKTYNHNISKKVVEFAEKNGAGTIKLELLTGIGQIERNKPMLRNWSFFELQTMIKYKAERAGIRVVYVDAYHTSTQCGSCSNHEPKQRIDQTTFICKNPECEGFDKKISADYNAALNIAKSKKIVTDKSETQSFQD
jgi:putative transposase